MIGRIVAIGVEQGFKTAVKRVSTSFIGEAVKEFFTDLEYSYNSDNRVLSEASTYRRESIKTSSEQVAEDNKTVSDLANDSLSQVCEVTLDSLETAYQAIDKPEITTHEPEQKTTTASTNDSLTDVMIKNNDSLLEAMHEQNQVMQSIQQSLKILAENTTIKNEVEKGKLAQSAIKNNIKQHELEVLSSTLPSINHSLAHIPLMLQSLDVISQNSISQSNILLGTNHAEWTKAERLYDIQQHQEKQASKLSDISTHQAKQADLAHKELNEEITDSSGAKTTPFKARAQKHAEESLTHKLENSITADDLDITDMDINIFSKVAEIIQDNQEEENNNGN